MSQGRYDLGCLYKFKILSETRRERNFSAPHMFDMQALQFIEQRRIATEFGFIEVPFNLSAALSRETSPRRAAAHR